MDKLSYCYTDQTPSLRDYLLLVAPGDNLESLQSAYVKALGRGQEPKILPPFRRRDPEYTSRVAQYVARQLNARVGVAIVGASTEEIQYMIKWAGGEGYSPIVFLDDPWFPRYRVLFTAENRRALFDHCHYHIADKLTEDDILARPGTWSYGERIC